MKLSKAQGEVLGLLCDHWARIWMRPKGSPVLFGHSTWTGGPIARSTVECLIRNGHLAPTRTRTAGVRSADFYQITETGRATYQAWKERQDALRTG